MSRIIAGSRRGRRLSAPPGVTTRPTSDRVREAAFSLIVDWAGTAAEPPDASLLGLSFLDLFAGSGAVGIEAASRGASPVVVVEQHPGAVEVIRRNIAATGLDLTVAPRSVEAQLAGRATAFDVIWADPPYAMPTDQLDALLADLFDRGWVAERGLVVVERSRRDPAPSWPVEVRDPWRRDYGETSVHLAMKEEA